MNYTYIHTYTYVFNFQNSLFQVIFYLQNIKYYCLTIKLLNKPLQLDNNNDDDDHLFTY